MSSQPCTRMWTAEAARDGRVGVAEKDGFLSHAAQCLVCAAEIRRLERLGAAVRAMRVRRLDELAVRRHRQELLARLDSAATKAARSRLHGWTVGAAALLLLGTAIAISFGLRAKANINTAPRVFMVHVQPVDARWSTSREGLTEIVVLEDGRLEVESTGRQGEHRLLVRVPDGEIEDVGTRFAVLVRSGYTQRIEVSEGLVVFHAQGGSDRYVGTGEHWERDLPRTSGDRSNRSEGEVVTEPSSSAPGPMPAARARVNSARAAHSTAPASARASGGSLPSRKPVERSPAASGESPTAAGRAFAAAMAAFREGEFAQAAAAFEQFVHDFPDDARSEDASFLLAVAHAKTGDVKGAGRLAREYLTRYPHGLRRTEAWRLTQTSEP